MGCGSCSGAGCGKNGGCSSGSCNRMNTYNWLADVPISEFDKTYPIVEISFNQGSRKDFYYNPKFDLEKGEMVVVEGVGGVDMGEISLTGEIVKLQIKKKGLHIKEGSVPKVLRMPSEADIERFRESKAREKETLIKSRKIIDELGLKMKLAEVEIQADGKKATFFYTADDRVDFRELIKKLAGEFRVRVEMKQIGIRQEAAKVGGIGSCGRELCCSTWLSNFTSVNTSFARYQNLSINQLKLSGQCGRLKCCLNYELDTYLEALQHFPKNADRLETEIGRAFLVKTDIFKNLMWYVYEGQSRHIPLTIDQVNEILEQNKKGIKTAELVAVELEKDKEEQVHENADYIDVVGQISLKNLERPRGKKGGRNNRNRKGRNQGNKKSNNQNRRNNPNKKSENRPENNSENKNRSNRKPGNKGNRTSSNSGNSNKPTNKEPRNPRKNKDRPPRKPRNNSRPKDSKDNKE